ncbi:protein-export chaperone SecB [Pseudomonas sp. 8209]|uniref:protein-export chaperone SecB n=1 Tax=Pseudomonas sp. 8209 TaxID=2967214 RepID=UPI0023646518|nr:protein-export chaperone SecB [Pseudomonas sp. 8209]MDD1956475.1 protein-export chaperone SecB [Pseudomonas sp. 8209]
MDRHPIQLVDVTVEELYFKKRGSSESEKQERDFSLTVSRSDYDKSEKMFSVKLDMEVEPDVEDKLKSFEMRLSIAGHFKVDEDAFPTDKIYNFAERNAPIILIPYIREHAYSLTVRAGVEPLIFPLVQVPSFKLVKQD